MSGNTRVAGIIGTAGFLSQVVTIEHVTNAGTITGSDVGGIVGDTL